MQYRIQRTFTTDSYRLRHGDTVEVTHKPWGNPANKEINMSGTTIEPTPTVAQVPYDTRAWANQATRTVAHWIMVNELSHWMHEAAMVANADELEKHLWMNAEDFEKELETDLDDVEWLEIAQWLIEDVPTAPLDVASEDDLTDYLTELMLLADRQNMDFERALRIARWQHIDRKAGG